MAAEDALLPLEVKPQRPAADRRVGARLLLASAHYKRQRPASSSRPADLRHLDRVGRPSTLETSGEGTPSAVDQRALRGHAMTESGFPPPHARSLTLKGVGEIPPRRGPSRTAHLGTRARGPPSLRVKRYGKTLYAMDHNRAKSLDPARELRMRHALQQFRKQHPKLEARKRCSQTEVRSDPEREMPIR